MSKCSSSIEIENFFEIRARGRNFAISRRSRWAREWTVWWCLKTRASDKEITNALTLANFCVEPNCDLAPERARCLGNRNWRWNATCRIVIYFRKQSAGCFLYGVAFMYFSSASRAWKVFSIGKFFLRWECEWKRKKTDEAYQHQNSNLNSNRQCR